MKKLFAILLSALLALAVLTAAFAEADLEEIDGDPALEDVADEAVDEAFEEIDGEFDGSQIISYAVDSDVIGTWTPSSMLVNGQLIEEIDPEVVTQLVFNEDGTMTSTRTVDGTEITGEGTWTIVGDMLEIDFPDEHDTISILEGGSLEMSTTIGNAAAFVYFERDTKSAVMDPGEEFPEETAAQETAIEEDVEEMAEEVIAGEEEPPMFTDAVASDVIGPWKLGEKYVGGEPVESSGTDPDVRLVFNADGTVISTTTQEGVETTGSGTWTIVEGMIEIDLDGEHIEASILDGGTLEMSTVQEGVEVNCYFERAE